MARSGNDVPSKLSSGFDEQTFNVRDSVYCLYKDETAYLAKVLDVRSAENGRREYRIHYKNWNKRYDEWVDAKRLRVCVDEEAIREPVIGAVRKRAKQDGKFVTFHVAMNFHFSEAILKILEADAEKMKRHLIELPARQSIRHILLEYERSLPMKPRHERSEVVMLGKQFERILSNCLEGWLLYPNEWKQHRELCKRSMGKKMIDIYGFVHLVRLMYAFQDMLMYFRCTDVLLLHFKRRLQHLINYLNRQRETFYSAVTYTPM